MNTKLLTPYTQADFTLFEYRPGIGVVLLPNDPVYTLVAVSRDFISTSGMKKEDVIGKSHFEVFPENPDDPQSSGEHSLRSSFEYILRHKKPHSLPLLRYDIPNGDGTFSEKYWKSSNAPVLNEEGEVVYIIHTAEDVTSQVKADKTIEEHKVLATAFQRVEESELKYRRLFDSIDQGFCVLEMIFDGDHHPIDYRFLETNPAFEEQTGLKGAIGKTAREMVPNLESHWFELYGKVATTGEPLRFMERSDAMGRWFDVFAYRIENEGSSKVGLLFRDITDRKKTEEELRESEERFRLMANTVPQSMWITDAEGRVEFLNKHWCDYCGEPFSETTATEISIKHLHPDDAPKVMETFSKAMQTGEPWEVEQRNRSKNGEYRWFLNRGTPFKDPQTGKVTKWYGVGIDIHDRKLAEEALKRSEELLEIKVQERTQELEKANQELKRSNQNLEEFAYAASHDMKEPIRKIHFFADRLKERLLHKLEEEDRRYFERLEAGTQRMTTLIDDLLLYSHVNRGIASVETVDMNQMLSFVLDDLELHIEQKGAKIEAGPLPIIKGRPRQLQQLFENLVGNALKYNKPNVTPHITISSNLVKGSDVTVENAAIDKAKMYHLISVEDNGIGFHQEDAERIFNVFTRLHGNAEYRGSGVGLSIVQKIVANHSGHVWAKATPGEGAVFYVLLPASQDDSDRK